MAGGFEEFARQILQSLFQQGGNEYLYTPGLFGGGDAYVPSSPLGDPFEIARWGKPIPDDVRERIQENEANAPKRGFDQPPGVRATGHTNPWLMINLAHAMSQRTAPTPPSSNPLRILDSGLAMEQLSQLQHALNIREYRRNEQAKFGALLDPTKKVF